MISSRVANTLRSFRPSTTLMFRSSNRPVVSAPGKWLQGNASPPSGPFTVNTRWRSTAAYVRENISRTATESVISAEVSGRYLSVSVENDEMKFPLVWLRDVCTCSSCHEKSSGGRLLILHDFNPELNVDSIKVDHASNSVAVVWDDGHHSSYELEWLKERSFTDDARDARREEIKISQVTWGSQDMRQVPTDTHENIMKDDDALYNWLATMEKYGIFLIKSAPLTTGVVTGLAERVNILRVTCYGREFHVRSKVNPTDVAYTTHTLGLHCDLPVYKYIPGIQMLHCISQIPTVGGENQFSDAFRAAETLKAEHPEDFKLLTEHTLEYVDVGDDAFKYNFVFKRPCISLGYDGEIDSVCIDDQKRASFANHLPLDVVQPLYSAMRRLFDIMYREENLIQFKLEEGDVVVFHNDRVFHARSGYTVLETGERFLTGGYMDWDDVRSKRRVLEAAKRQA